jgi:GPH family glycoside/pentoside/hexuronide:cation symporter
MPPSTEARPRDLGISLPLAVKNSPLAYGLGSFGLESLSTVFAGFYMFYYIDNLGLAVGMAAIINIIYGIWDAVNDPIVGFLSDNTRTRWGRRKPWLLVGLPFFLGILVLVYKVPRPFLEGNALFWYAMIIFFLFEAANTVMSVNYSALFPELFKGLLERTRASSYYQGLSMLGGLIGFAIPPMIYARYGFVPMAVCFAAIAGIALFIGISRVNEDTHASNAPRVNLKNAFGEVLKDRSFLLFTIDVTFLMFIIGAYTLAVPFWVKYTLGARPEATSLIFTTVFIAAILSVTLWSRLVRGLGIKRTWLISIGLGVISAVVFGIASNLAAGVIGAVLTGTCMGGINVCRMIIMANYVDQNFERTGQRREGVYYSLFHVIGKLTKIQESLALVLLAVLFGYVNGENPGPQPGNAFRFLMSVFPLIFAIIALMIAKKLPIENEQSAEHSG